MTHTTGSGPARTALGALLGAATAALLVGCAPTTPDSSPVQPMAAQSPSGPSSASPATTGTPNAHTRSPSPANTGTPTGDPSATANSHPSGSPANKVRILGAGGRLSVDPGYLDLGQGPSGTIFLTNESVDALTVHATVDGSHAFTLDPIDVTIPASGRVRVTVAVAATASTWSYALLHWTIGPRPVVDEVTSEVAASPAQPTTIANVVASSGACTSTGSSRPVSLHATVTGNVAGVTTEFRAIQGDATSYYFWLPLVQVQGDKLTWALADGAYLTAGGHFTYRVVANNADGTTTSSSHQHWFQLNIPSCG